MKTTTYTHLTVVLDRTGSMESIRDDTIGGFNAFLKQQQAAPGRATLTLVQFDSQDPYEVIHRFMPLEQVPALTRETFVPRASTPLLDAMGRAINDLEAGLAALKKANRPSKVVMVIVTDGQENASREFTKAQIEAMVKAKIAKEDWQFVFLSADLAAIGDARAVGIGAHAALLHHKDARGTASAWEALSAHTAEYRRARKHKIGFNQGDRHHADDPARKAP